MVRLSHYVRLPRWPSLWLAIGWLVLLACLPWWLGLPLLVALAIALLARVGRLQPQASTMRQALRWGLPGVLIAAYRAWSEHAAGLTYTMLAALVGFSLLMLLEGWLDRKRVPATKLDAAEWHEIAIRPIGPGGAIIILQQPVWMPISEASADDLAGFIHDGSHYVLPNGRRIHNVAEHVSVATGKRWIAWSFTAGRGVVLYDRVHDKEYRLRGWQLYGWDADDAWLSRHEDSPPLSLSHVLGQDTADD